MQALHIETPEPSMTLNQGLPGNGKIGVQKVHVGFNLIEGSDESLKRFSNFSRQGLQMSIPCHSLQKQHS
jgi:hypothetical protein